MQTFDIMDGNKKGLMDPLIVDQSVNSGVNIYIQFNQLVLVI